ncbi:MAG: DNA alkylation repair protein [Holosporaceae bacterium]|nr:DNA alkylation repair protein [Holosporaceae bacterium]
MPVNRNGSSVSENSETAFDSVGQIIREIKAESSEKYAEFHRKMIQSENGYGKGDTVIGCPVPNLRKIAKKYCAEISLKDTEKLLQSNYHEARALALIIMTLQFQSGDETRRKNIMQIYLNNLKFVNNWDLVDISAPRTAGLYFKSEDPVFKRLSESENLWENRIAVVATLSFIKNGDFELTLKLCEKFLKHKHHLIHKACGWMLREIGKKSPEILIKFLRKHAADMPKIMLSYARERIRDVQI